MAIAYTDQEKLDLVNQIYETLEKGLPVLQWQADYMASQNAEYKKKQQKDQLANKALDDMTKGMSALTKSMYEGEQGMAAMNGAVDAVAGAASLVIALIPGVGIFAKIIGTVAVGAIAGFVKTVNEQGDALFKTYQDLSKTGMATAGGVTEVFNNMQRFNYGIKELGQMTELLKENSQALANFGGTAAQGTRAFANAADEIQHSNIGRTFQMMGKTPDEINRGIAMFIKSQQGIGIQNSEIQRNLAAKSSDYIMKMDLLTKLTGMSAEKLQSNLDEANAQDAFNQVQYELKKKADAGDQKAKAQFEANEAFAKKYAGTELGKDFFASVGGDVSAMGKMMMTMPGVARLVQSGQYTVDQLENAAGKDSERVRAEFGHLYKLNAANDFLYSGKELSTWGSRFADQSAKQQEEMAKAEQELQTKGLDPTTKKMVELRIEQQKTRDSLQNLVNIGINPATSALELFAKVTNRIVEMIPGTGSSTTTGGKETSESSGSSSSTGPNASTSSATKSSASKIDGKDAVTIGDETRIGGDRNWRSNNPGNIIYGAFAIKMGAIGSDGKFAIFPTLEMGRKAADVLLKSEAYADKSAAEALKKWAPGPTDNPALYADTIAKQTGIDMGKKYKDLTREEQSKFLDAMTKVEGGRAGTIKKADGTQPQTETAKTEVRNSSSNPGVPTTETSAPYNPGQPPWLQNPKVSGDDGWNGMLTGPSSGYRPNVIMHGTEDLTITPKSDMNNNIDTGYIETNGMLQQQTAKLDELIRILGDQQGNELVFQQLAVLEQLNRHTQDQVNVSTKILQASR
jgi:hypothetical protein